MLRIFQLNLRWRIERELMKWRIFAICLHLSRVYHSFVHWILARLIIELSFKLTFWTRIEIELNCSHFQLDSSRVAHIFNLMQLDLCYDPSYASMLIAMLMAMLMTIADRSSLGYRIVPRSTLFRVSLCSSESYR